MRLEPAGPRLVSRSAATLALALWLSADVAYAAGGKSDRGFIALAATQTTTKVQENNVKGETEITIYDIGAGYIFGPGIALGLKYWSYNVNGGDSITSGYGPSVGFVHDSGVFALYSYLLTPTKEFTANSVKNTYRGGSGSVIDVGYAYAFDASWGVGVQLTQSIVNYEKREIGTQTEDLEGKWQDQSLFPYLTLFVFL